MPEDGQELSSKNFSISCNGKTLSTNVRELDEEGIEAIGENLKNIKQAINKQTKNIFRK
jgi:hypothetical protein